jgi:hypothetical protein
MTDKTDNSRRRRPACLRRRHGRIEGGHARFSSSMIPKSCRLFG